MNCTRCGASTFSWDGGYHRCIVIGHTNILFQDVAAGAATEDWLDWLLGRTTLPMPTTKLIWNREAA